MNKTYCLNVVKTFLISLNMINIESKLSMVPLAVAASILWHYMHSPVVSI